MTTGLANCLAHCAVDDPSTRRFSLGPDGEQALRQPGSEDSATLTEVTFLDHALLDLGD